MQKIGNIKFVQVQQSSLKEARPDATYYNPSPLLTVPRIQLTTDGIIGLTDDDTQLIDVHNAQHPSSKHRGINPISIGFTSHYKAMRDEMGDHLTDGIAGENIIIDCDQVYTPATIGQRIAIKLVKNDQFIYLNNVLSIPPCEPFSRFARAKSSLAPQVMKSTLQFLSDGMRGFQMQLETIDGDGIIQAGDEVYRLDN